MTPTGNRTHNLRACSAVPQPIASLHTPSIYTIIIFITMHISVIGVKKFRADIIHLVVIMNFDISRDKDFDKVPGPNFVSLEVMQRNHPKRRCQPTILHDTAIQTISV